MNQVYLLCVWKRAEIETALFQRNNIQTCCFYVRYYRKKRCDLSNQKIVYCFEALQKNPEKKCWLSSSKYIFQRKVKFYIEYTEKICRYVDIKNFGFIIEKFLLY